jgi:opacity protein-like surface antigen
MHGKIVMRATSSGLFLAAGLALLGLAPSAALAQVPDWTQGWSGQGTIYAWLPVINGKQEGLDGQPLVDLNTNDVLSRLDMALMGAAQLSKGRWTLLFDAIYVDMSNEADWLQGQVTTKTGLRLGMYTLAAAYRVYDDKGFVDVYGGGRYFDATTSFGIATDNRGRTADVDLQWGDPIVGVRGGWPLSQRWSLSGFADVGGVDGSSDLSWELYAGGNFDFTDRWQGTIGYRYLSVLYQASSRAKIDLDIQGPLFGITYKF